MNRPLLFAFGDWPVPDDSPLVPETDVARRLIRWLAGDNAVAFDEDLMRLVRAEFEAQDRFRCQLLDGVRACVRELQQRAETARVDADMPYTPSEAHSRGVLSGQYLANATAAQAVSDAINAAVLALGMQP